MNELADIFTELDDPRAANARRHSLHDILVIALCAVISGGQTCTDMELFGHAKRDLLQSFLKLENGIPSHGTFSRVLGMLDPEEFHTWLLGFMGQLPKASRVWWHWTARLCAVLTTGPKGVRRCTWPALGPRSSDWCWDKWPLTISPTRLLQCPSCWKC